jgi:hypothetical protein
LAEQVQSKHQTVPPPAEPAAEDIEDAPPAEPAAAQPDVPSAPVRLDEGRQVSGRSEDELWAGALRLDATHRAEHGRAITRDALREGLGIGTNRATELNRRLREHTAHTARLAAGLDPAPIEPPRSGADLVLSTPCG